jgi:hypothetical protein
MAAKFSPCSSIFIFAMAGNVFAASCHQARPDSQQSISDTVSNATMIRKTTEPLVTNIYTADPAAHVFGDKLYVYPSHDIQTAAPENAAGDHFDMRDYHVLSMNSIGGQVTDNGVALDLKDIPWAERQLWAPDAAEKNGIYYLYFPAKDRHNVFRIGVATSASPTGPFAAEPEPIAGSYSIDPAVFKDTDATFYIYFGGIWGGQLQRWTDGKYDPNGSKTDRQKDDEPAIGPRVARMNDDLKSLGEPAREIQILDENGRPLRGGDHARRFFEASWMHKYRDKYYFSYSTGDTHFICYATGDSPYGPFVWRGVILNPVIGWTNHHSIVEFLGRWYLFYHDSALSGGKTHLRCVKVTELIYKPDGTIVPLNPD